MNMIGLTMNGLKWMNNPLYFFVIFSVRALNFTNS